MTAVPLRRLAYIRRHKQKLFAGMRKHIGQKKPRIGPSLPVIPWHFFKKRSFSIHDFIVRNGQNKILGKSINHGKGQHVLMEPPVHGLFGKIIQRVMHPAHVPFHAEAKPARVGGARNTGPGRRLFGNR